MTEEERFFARVTAGLEQVAWQDVERRTGARLEGFGHRRIDFSYAGPPAALLDLRGVDDVYAFVARLGGIDRARASLARLAKGLASVGFEPALATIRAARALGERPSFRVTSSHLGRRNYSRYDVEGALADALVDMLGWSFVPNAPDEAEPDLDLRVLLEDDWALLGLRLGAAPLHRRAYKVASQPGSLKPPVAYCLALLAALAPGALTLDLACGAGTILVEAAALAPGGALIGVDVEPHAIELARENLDAAGLAARIAGGDELATIPHPPALAPAPVALLYHGDAAAAPLPARSVDAVITNLPWGKQVAAGDDLSALYAGVLGAVARALRPAGRAVLLTDQADLLLAALASRGELRLASSLPISLFGRHPTIFVVERG